MNARDDYEVGLLHTEIGRLRAEIDRLRNASTDGKRAETFYAIRRTDGGLVYDDFEWYGVDRADDWTPAEEATHYEPTEYEIVLMTVTPVAKRTFGESAPNDASLLDGDQ